MDLREIKILGTAYALEYTDYISRDEFRIGEIDYMNQKIYILKDLGKDLEKVTLIHEIIHGILNQLGFEEENDEHLIQSLSNSLYQVFTENKIF